MLRVQINNTSFEAGASVLGANNNVRHYSTMANLKDGMGTETSRPSVTDYVEPGKLSIEFTSEALYASVAYDDSDTRSYYDSLKTAFFAFLCQGNSGMNITGIRLERVLDWE